MTQAVTVAIRDANGNVVTSDTSIVTLTLSSGTFAGGGNTATASAVNGVDTFGGLVVNTAGSYTLAASDGTLTGAISSSFTVTAGTSIFIDFNSGASSFTANLTVHNNGGANNTSLAWGAGFGVQDQPGPAAGGGLQSRGRIALAPTPIHPPATANLCDGAGHTIAGYAPPAAS